VTGELSWNMSVRQSVILADTREAQVQVGADVPSVAEKNCLHPLGRATAQGGWLLPRSSGSHRSEILRCNSR